MEPTAAGSRQEHADSNSCPGNRDEYGVRASWRRLFDVGSQNAAKAASALRLLGCQTLLEACADLFVAERLAALNLCQGLTANTRRSSRRIARNTMARNR
jgi:hypothetical protein